jgi:2-polyprenyl-3-methyl-5-hydroxy-6-metoxy-1,4-benzoquinol methylase
MNSFRNIFIKNYNLKLFDISAHKLRGDHFFESIFQYRKKIFFNQKKRIKKLKDYNCNLCSKNKGDIFLSWKKFYLLIKCKSCGAVSPNIEHENENEFIDSVYNNPIYTQKSFDAIYKNYKYRENTFGLERYNYTIKRLGLKNNCKVLDLGCGFGYYVKFLTKKKINVKGIEPAVNIANFCKKKLNLNIHHTPLSLEKDNQYNLITLFDVIEHLKDPLDYFRIINKKIKKNGFCVAYTPNIHSLAYALMGSDQNTLLPFEHLCFFNDNSFSYLAKNTGFKIHTIENFGWDVMDYLMLKEYKDKIKYTKNLKDMTNLIQAVLDKNHLSNHFRVTFKKN